MRASLTAAQMIYTVRVVSIELSGLAAAVPSRRVFPIPGDRDGSALDLQTTHIGRMLSFAKRVTRPLDNAGDGNRTCHRAPYSLETGGLEEEARKAACLHGF
jgi:hypothetical protein